MCTSFSDDPFSTMTRLHRRCDALEAKLKELRESFRDISTKGNPAKPDEALQTQVCIGNLFCLPHLTLHQALQSDVSQIDVLKWAEGF